MGTEKIIKIEKIKVKRKFVTLYDIQMSGGDTFCYNGIVIHNSFVERGMPAHYERVEGHFRKNGVFVKGFTRYMHERKPRNFIRNSLNAAFERFAPTFDSNLREKFKTVIWK